MVHERWSAEVVLNKQRCLLRGYFFQIRGSWKSWGSQIFFCEKYWGQLEINKKLLGGHNLLLKFVFIDNPHESINATLNGDCILVYDNTAVPRGYHTISDYQIRGSQNIAEVPLELMNPYSKVWWPHNSFINVFVCVCLVFLFFVVVVLFFVFVFNQFKKQWFQWNLI